MLNNKNLDFFNKNSDNFLDKFCRKNLKKLVNVDTVQVDNIINPWTGEFVGVSLILKYLNKPSLVIDKEAMKNLIENEVIEYCLNN